MKKVITYGTYDLLHYGHIRLLKRAKALGDYLIVGVTADDFDKTRGKINVQQSLSERIEAVRATGLADEIIVEEYEGQKIDDITRYDVDIFTVGSDWKGTFDYLKEYCHVVYLERTEGVSSSAIRDTKRALRLGIYGDTLYLNKFFAEAQYVNGVKISAICTNNMEYMSEEVKSIEFKTKSYDELLEHVDAVYIFSYPQSHYVDIKRALEKGVHVLCESPISMNEGECLKLFDIANEHNCFLMEALKTAYSTAYYRLLLLIKSGIVGKVVSVDATCTSIREYINLSERDDEYWNGFTAWGPTALLPIFQLLGIDYDSKEIVTVVDNLGKDIFTRVSFNYKTAVASIKVGSGVKSEGELVISGTKGYVYVPAPWWKTDYFEVRYEDQTANKRYFYQLEGEGIRYQIAVFAKSVENRKTLRYIKPEITKAISSVMEDFNNANVIKI